jgi:beta-lactamase regulating signal transducer with metallopeptidase domain
MTRFNEWVLNSVFNSLWMIPIVWCIAALGAYALKNAAANYRYAIWLAALVLCVVAPLLSSTQILSAMPVSFESTTLQSSPAVPTNHQTSAADDVDSPLNHVRKRNWQIVDAPREKLQLLTVAYSLFILLAVIRLARLWWRKETLRKSATQTALSSQIESVANYCRSLFRVRQVRVARSSLARVPCTLGVHRPLIVLPDAFCRYISDDTLLSVVAHEMAHVSRRDYLTKLLSEVISLPVAFHPITLLIKRQLDRERELACDELVTRRAMMPDTYARSLLSAASLSILPAPQAITLSIFDGRILEKRIMRLTKSKARTSKRVGRTLLVTVLFSLCACAVSLSVLGVELRTGRAADFSPTNVAVGSETATLPTTNAPAQQQPEKRLNGPDPEERVQAACTAGRKRDLEAIPVLIGMLGDETKTRSINCWGNGRWSPALQTFRAPSPGEEAAIALASMGRPAFTPLQSQLDSSNAVVRRNAAWAIGELTNMLPNERSSAVPQLIILLGDRDAWVRMAAGRAIGELRDDRAIETLIATLSDSDWRVRQMIAWALSEMKADRAVNALCAILLSDARAEVRRGAAEALGEIRSEAALASLTQALNDPESSVSAKVRWAIEEIEDSDG